MFSFFRRNKSKPSSTNNNNNNENKVSLNMQLAIERQQASLHKTLEFKRQNDVNDRDQRNVNLHTPSAPLAYIEDEYRVDKNRSTALPSLVSEHDDKTHVPQSSACAPQKHQNYDQYRDAKKRTSYFLNESIEYAARLATTPINCYLPNEKLFSSSSSSSAVVVVASPIKDQKCLAAAGIESSNAYNSVDEVMGRGRNRNKNRGNSGPTFPQNHNRNIVKNQKSDDENVSKNVNGFREVVSSENSNVDVTKFEIEQSPEPQNLNTAADAAENSEKSASISCENVLHDEDSCSNNSQPENKNDNIATSDEEKTAAAATNIANVHDEENEKIVASVASGVKNDEHLAQQVGSPLQKSPSARRVTFAPSPPRSVTSSFSDDEEEETISSEDIFYEAAESPESQQKLRILSTVTSHSSDSSRTDEEASETETSTASGGSLSSNFSNDNKNNNKDVVCAKIILSVNEGEKLPLSDNETDDIKPNAFSSSDDTSISSHIESAPKKVKTSYLHVGEDTIALPDIVAETSLYEHQNDEMANLGSQASNYIGGGNSVSSQQIEIVDQMQVKVNELCMRIDELQRDLDVKTGAVDRLQSELEATNKEGECVRQRLRFQDGQLEKVKERQDLSAEEGKEKYASLEEQHTETVGKLHKMQSLASNLNVQLAQASVDVEKLRQERDELLDKLTAQEKLLRDILQTATDDREQIIAKWKHDFEQLRNVNCDREEHLMEDCEWKLRSMMKQCKEKLEKAESEKVSLKDQAQIDKQMIKSQRDEIKALKACEREANQLRGLSQEQKDSISSMLQRIDDLKAELSTVKRRLQEEIDSCLQIKRDCAYQLSEKERSCGNRVEIARGEAAIEWEDRLFVEMSRLTLELEQVHLDERNSALNKQKAENLLEVQVLLTKFKQQEKYLLDEIAALKLQLSLKQEELRETQTKADNQLLENRAYLDRREREHQKESDRHQSEIERQLRLHSDLIEEIKGEHKREKEQIKASFYRSLEQIKEEFANEITLTTETLHGKHKREMDEQWKQLVHEREEALLSAENRHRIRMEDADNKLRAVSLKHQRQLNDVKDQFDLEKARNDTRDVSNSQEIDTLRRKCLCLTKLFEEMRMRYERRDPRPEDLRQIDELKSVVDSQEKDIFYLTEQLRDFQLQQQQQNQENQTNQQNTNQSKKNKGMSKNNKNISNTNKNNANNNGNSNNNDQPQMRHHAEPQQTKQSANHERDQQQYRMKPPPLIKTIIYEEENENELYEQQIREEREHAKKSQDQEFESELQSQQNGVTVELVPESPDYTTKNRTMEEISEAHLISDQEFYIPDVVVLPPTSPDDKNREIRIEVISTIEPANIQIVSNGNSALDELD